MTVTVKPLTPHAGAEITGMSARDLVDRRAADDCRAALQKYGVLVYREVHIDDAGLVAFSRMLGEVAVVPTGEHEYPEIQTITLDPSKTNALLASYRQGNFHWHIDGATQAVPQKGTLLSAREVADEGGDTEFASTYAAYDALSAADHAQIANLRVDLPARANRRRDVRAMIEGHEVGQPMDALRDLRALEALWDSGAAPWAVWKTK